MPDNSARWEPGRNGVQRLTNPDSLPDAEPPIPSDERTLLTWLRWAEAELRRMLLGTPPVTDALTAGFGDKPATDIARRAYRYCVSHDVDTTEIKKPIALDGFHEETTDAFKIVEQCVKACNWCVAMLHPAQETGPTAAASTPDSPSSFSRIVQERAEHRQREAAAQAEWDERMRRLTEFRAFWSDAWGRLLSTFDTKNEYRLTDAVAAGTALAEIGALLNRLGEVREEMRDCPAADRLRALSESNRWFRASPRTAAALLYEAARGAGAEELARMLTQADDDPDLRFAYGWLEFYRDRLLSQPGKPHPWGFIETPEAMPAVESRFDDIRFAEMWLCGLPPRAGVHPRAPDELPARSHQEPEGKGALMPDTKLVGQVSPSPQGHPTSDTDPLDALFAHRDRIRALGPTLEALAVEYDCRSEQLRIALNAMLGACRTVWRDALYAVGPQLSRLDLTDAAWGYNEPPKLNCSDADMARFSLLRLAQTAAAGNRKDYERVCGNLDKAPNVSTEAAKTRVEFAGHLMARSRNRDRDECLERARKALSAVGLDLSNQTMFALRQAECSLTPMTEDALLHWIDTHYTPVQIVDGQIAPLGWRAPQVVETAKETEPEPAPSPATGIGGKPADPSAEHPCDPDTVHTVADARDLLRFRRENAAQLRSVFDNPMSAVMNQFRSILPPLEQVRLAAQFRKLVSPKMSEEAAERSAVFALLANAARQECGRELDEDALAAIVSHAAIQYGRSSADVWLLTLAEFARLKWPDLRTQDRATEATGALGDDEKDGNAERPSPAEADGSNAGKAKGIPKEEAEVRVSDWLEKHAADDPDAVTRDAVAAGTGVSAGGVSNTAAWKAFCARRNANKKPVARDVPLTETMKAIIPADCEPPDELAALIEEQKADEAEQERRRKRRHGSS